MTSPEQQPEQPATGPTEPTAESVAAAPAAEPATEPAVEPAAAEPAVETTVATSVTVHRSPRYSSFMIVGAVIGALGALVLTLAWPQNREYDPSQVFGFLLIAGVVVGVALGSIVALLVDRFIGRTSATVVADRLASSTKTHSSENTD